MATNVEQFKAIAKLRCVSLSKLFGVGLRHFLYIALLFGVHIINVRKHYKKKNFNILKSRKPSRLFK